MKPVYSAKCPNKNWKALIELFAKEVQAKEAEVDHDNEELWPIGAPLCEGLPGERPYIDWSAVEKLLFS